MPCARQRAMHAPPFAAQAGAWSGAWSSCGRSSTGRHTLCALVCALHPLSAGLPSGHGSLCACTVLDVPPGPGPAHMPHPSCSMPPFHASMPPFHAAIPCPAGVAELWVHRGHAHRTPSKTALTLCFFRYFFVKYLRYLRASCVRAVGCVRGERVRGKRRSRGSAAAAADPPAPRSFVRSCRGGGAA